MRVSVKRDIVVLATDDRIWFDAESIIQYLREVEAMANGYLREAQDTDDYRRAIAAHATGDMLRQIADGMVLTSMTAAEAIRSKRESRRRT